MKEKLERKSGVTRLFEIAGEKKRLLVLANIQEQTAGWKL